MYNLISYTVREKPIYTVSVFDGSAYWATKVYTESFTDFETALDNARTIEKYSPSHYRVEINKEIRREIIYN